MLRSQSLSSEPRHDVAAHFEARIDGPLATDYVVLGTTTLVYHLENGVAPALHPHVNTRQPRGAKHRQLFG